MNGGDAAQLPRLMKGLLKEYVAEGAPLPGPVAEIVVDSASEGKAAPLPDRSRAPLDRWLPGVDPEAPVEAEDDVHDCRYDAALARVRRAWTRGATAWSCGATAATMPGACSRSQSPWASPRRSPRA